MKISAIAAIDENGAIGKQGGLLCHLPADLRHFKAVTMGSPIIMGRKTFESFPHGPLPGRLNIILTRDASYSPAGTVVCHDIDSALEVAARSGKGECFVIGGGQVYNDFAALCDELHLTVIHARFADADTFFPAIDMEQWETIKKEDYAATSVILILLIPAPAAQKCLKPLLFPHGPTHCLPQRRPPCQYEVACNGPDARNLPEWGL